MQDYTKRTTNGKYEIIWAVQVTLAFTCSMWKDQILTRNIQMRKNHICFEAHYHTLTRQILISCF